MTFGEKLLKLRKGAGLSQENLAEALEVSRQAVSKWELGEALPDVQRLLELSQAFEVSTDYLLNDAWGEDRPKQARAPEGASGVGPDQSAAPRRGEGPPGGASPARYAP